ncbi:MAG TPA: hypothetical protein VFR24_06160, partial [Candidatus Angelobacter sp.]|nr:hypothetical protein [Candidatus Angelobacter sp.]
LRSSNFFSGDNCANRDLKRNFNSAQSIKTTSQPGRRLLRPAMALHKKQISPRMTRMTNFKMVLI